MSKITVTVIIKAEKEEIDYLVKNNPDIFQNSRFTNTDGLILQRLKREKRLQLILDNFNGESVRQEVLYVRVRKHGYRMLRKTFVRDIMKLEEINKIRRILNHDDGSYIMLYLNSNS